MSPDGALPARDPSRDVTLLAPPPAFRLYRVEDADWWDIGRYQHHRCSTCGDTALYYRWTGVRWWKLCEVCLVPHLERNLYGDQGRV